MGRRKICWKTRFWGHFLHLTPPYSRKVDILVARDLKFWTFGTFRKHSLPVTDFKRLENLVFATVTCDTTLPTQKTSYQFRRERTVGQNSSYVLDCSLNSKLQNICDKTSTSRVPWSGKPPSVRLSKLLSLSYCTTVSNTKVTPVRSFEASVCRQKLRGGGLLVKKIVFRPGVLQG